MTDNNTPQINEVNNQPQGATSQKIIDRRDFITLMLGSGASFALATILAQPLQNLVMPIIEGDDDGHGESPHRWVMVIDLGKCVGCDYCVHACQAVNDTRPGHLWNIRETDETPLGNTFHVTRPCLHCNNPPCVEVCPVHATYSRPDGIVVMDYDKCIGCRYCQVACPYEARTFNWEERTDENPMVPEFGRPEVERRPRGVVEKCTFCIHRIDAGLAQGLMPGVDEAATPACVNICPVTARWFGDINDPNSEVAQIINNTPTLRLREDLGTDPNVYYIPAEGMRT